MTFKAFTTLGCTLVFSAFFLNTLAQIHSIDTGAVSQINAKRAEQFEALKGEKSPLEKKARKKLKKINYFPIDLSYRVKAKFVKTETPDLFKMKTTTSRLPDYRKYGELHFTLAGVDYKLNVYQSPDVIRMPQYADHLFLPFTDRTNGEDTYEVGRYIDLTIPSGEEVVIDFNLAYNPYCSYNHNYSCPIPPVENDMPIEIKAGEKKFH
jgi:uncharacterized protein (DUF1684 family)